MISSPIHPKDLSKDWNTQDNHDDSKNSAKDFHVDTPFPLPTSSNLPDSKHDSDQAFLLALVAYPLQGMLEYIFPCNLSPLLPRHLAQIVATLLSTLLYPNIHSNQLTTLYCLVVTILAYMMFTYQQYFLYYNQQYLLATLL